MMIIYLIFIFPFLFSQEIPAEFYQYKYQNLIINSGENWHLNTTLGSPRFQDLKNEGIKKDSLYIDYRLGFYNLNKSIALYGFGHFKFKKYLYGFLYPRIVNNPNSFPRYSGIQMDIERGGVSSGETDMSGIGFQNDWLSFQLGRGRECWGAGQDIQLVLSDFSSPYDYVALSSNYGNVRVKYIHGFLESNNNRFNRYITARGIEYSTKSNFLIGLSETVIYSGDNRPIDLGYLNPMSTHLEIELNDRLNNTGTSNANAVWMISIDWMLTKNFRFSLNYLYDEFILDDVEKKNGKENGKANSFSISYVPFIINKGILNLYLTRVMVGTPTFRHGNGMNNFVQRGSPLGYILGSDFIEYKSGFNYLNKKNIILNLETGFLSIGEESITNRPYDRYEDYLKGVFPSGETKNTLYISANIDYWWMPNISNNFQLKISKIQEVSLSFVVGLNIYYGKKFNL
jgi:hypothetical protein